MHHRNVPRVGVTAQGHPARLWGCDDEHAQAHRRLGYDYLTRQVAALDATEKGHTGLASYYTERGEYARGVDRLRHGRDRRSERRRPGDGGADASFVRLRLASAGRAAAAAAGGPTSPRRLQDATRLGAPFKIVEATSARSGSRWRSGSRRINAAGWPSTRRSRRLTGRGSGPRWRGSSSEPSMAASRSMLGSWRTDRKDSRPRTQTVAGYDLTFSPVKSVSTLWAVADPRRWR